MTGGEQHHRIDYANGGWLCAFCGAEGDDSDNSGCADYESDILIDRLEQRVGYPAGGLR